MNSHSAYRTSRRPAAISALVSALLIATAPAGFAQVRDARPSTPESAVLDGYIREALRANLALALMLDLRHAGEPVPDAALLFYGVYDADHDTASHRRCGDGAFGLSSAKMAWYRAHYLAGGSRADDPRVSPLRAASLDGLPPLLVTAAELDPLHDDSAALAARLAQAGTPFEFKRYAGLHHGFMQMAGLLPESDRAFDDAAAFLRARFFAPPPHEETST